MNVTFRLPSEALESEFAKASTAAGLDGLKGHRSVGGLRASIYNAFPEEGIDTLVVVHAGVRADEGIAVPRAASSSGAPVALESAAMAATEHDVTRIEAFSDAVFGFAITLLVVSLAVPNSFDELLQVMKGLPVFAVTFAILLMMWQEHHNLFKRFPSSDGVTIWLNGALLFVVLSYIYPLKFLFSGIVGPAGMRFGRARRSSASTR